MELKVPPVVVVLLMAALMGIVAWAAPGFRRPLQGTVLLAIGLALVGVTPEASSALVRSGIYSMTRNPMYLGFSFILLGWAVFLSNALAFCVIPGFLLYMNRYQIRPEERALAARFGQKFEAYAARVRRWL